MFVQKVTWFDNETPPSPNYAGGRQSKILGKGQAFGWSSKVTDAGENDAPLGCSQLRSSSDTTVQFRRHTFITGALEDISV